MQFFYRLRLVDREPFHEPAEFLIANVTDGLGVLRPLEFALFQAFIQQHEAVAFPIERLEPVVPMTAEKKQTVLKRVELIVLLDQGGQTVNGTLWVGMRGGKRRCAT
jgi:hypothetical protein